MYNFLLHSQIFIPVVPGGLGVGLDPEPAVDPRKSGSVMGRTVNGLVPLVCC
jgi:hypothetical protein